MMSAIKEIIMIMSTKLWNLLIKRSLRMKILKMTTIIATIVVIKSITDKVS